MVPTPDVDGDIETRVRTLWNEAFNERKLDALDAITQSQINHARRALNRVSTSAPRTRRCRPADRV